MNKAENQIKKRQLTGSYLISVISISLVLFLIGIVGFIVINTRQLGNYVKENIGFNIELKDEIREADILQIRKIIDSKKYVKSTEYITREQAAKETQAALGEDFINFLGFNPLPSSIKVKLHAEYANPDSIAKIEMDLARYKQVNEIYYRKSFVDEINANVKKISAVIVSFALVLFLIAITLINNTIRLSIYSKRFIINTMQLVGATRRFIRRPFVVKSAWHGLISGLVSIALLLSIIYLAQGQIEDFFYFVNLNYLLILFACLIVAGIIINTLSTFFAVNKYLSSNIDSFYN
jgi:cell division transport system permease protein